MVTQQLLFMLILAYLQIDLCLFCAMPAVNKDIWRIISTLKRKALLLLPIAHLFLLRFRPNVCSTGKVSNGKLLEEMSWTWNAHGYPTITLNVRTDHSELPLSLSPFWTCSPKPKETIKCECQWLQENHLASFRAHLYLGWVALCSLLIKNSRAQPPQRACAAVGCGSEKRRRGSTLETLPWFYHQQTAPINNFIHQSTLFS